MSSTVVYAIVRAGGRQEKVSVGDVVVVDLLSGENGDSVEFPAVLLVDGDKVTTDADALAKVKVTAEIIREEKGPKLQILKYKNKSRQHVVRGHRQKHTRVKVTSIA